MAGGQCNCGAIGFEIGVEPADVLVCHCSICRRATGGNGIAVIIVDNDDFQWTHGEDLMTSWKKPDADWEISFCPTCGSPLPDRNDESRMFVPAGLISEGGEALQVKHHIWVDSKAAWDVIGDTGHQHPGKFERSKTT